LIVGYDPTQYALMSPTVKKDGSDTERFNRMPARFEGIFLDGVNLRLLDEHRDRRGSFTEVYCDNWGLPIIPAQWSVVRSVAGTLRGMHLHMRHSEYFLCISGRACIGLYDLRPASRTKNTSMLIHVNGVEPVAVSFPCGIAHGWLFITDAIHWQAVSETYANYKEDDNLGVHWSDPALNLPWPEQPKIVSPEANAFGSLAELRAKIGKTLHETSSPAMDRQFQLSV
jgi:dTDP-4-dehydrorhamnose 3,5-epimerase